MSSVTLLLTLVADARAGSVVEIVVGRAAAGTTSTSATTEASGTRLRVAPQELGIPATLNGDPIDDQAFRLPSALVDLLRAELGEATGSPICWLQLVAPFGYLALLPWERLLREQLGVRVVRLPAVALARRRPGNSLQVTLLVAVPNPRRSSPLRTQVHSTRVAASSRLRIKGYADKDTPPAMAPDSFSAVDVDRLVRAILRGSPRRTTTVNVVTTPWIHHDLKARWRRERSDFPVHLHDAHALRADLEDSPQRTAQTPWLRVLKAAQNGEQSDVVHIVSHASVTDTSARLVVADPLPSSTNVASRYVSIPALGATLDELGAWAVCLTAAPPRESVPQMRYLASRLAVLRPGPSLMTDYTHDPRFHDVEEGYRFLFSRKPMPPPMLESGVIHCEPFRVTEELREPTGATTVIEPPPAEQPHEATAKLIAADTTPMWLAAAQRFVEQRQVDLTRLEGGHEGASMSPEAAAIVRGVRQALSTIQDVLESQAEKIEARDG